MGTCFRVALNSLRQRLVDDHHVVCIGMHEHDAIGHDADVAFPEHKIAAQEAFIDLGNWYRNAEFCLLHVAVARRGDTGRVERHLHEARTIYANARASAPKIGDADKALGNLDEIARGSAERRDVTDRHEAAMSEFHELLSARARLQH